jgi:hypothetical protein
MALFYRVYPDDREKTLAAQAPRGFPAPSPKKKPRFARGFFVLQEP